MLSWDLQLDLISNDFKVFKYSAHGHSPTPKYIICVKFCSGSCSPDVAPDPAAWVSPGNLLEMQILSLAVTRNSSGVNGVGGVLQLCFNKPQVVVMPTEAWEPLLSSPSLAFLLQQVTSATCLSSNRPIGKYVYSVPGFIFAGVLNCSKPQVHWPLL